jgi:sugar phosphate isomerase/epimerase
MDKHWSHYCTMSIVHFMAFPATIGGEGPIVETVSEIAQDPFFGAIEITWIKDPGKRREVRSILDTSRTKIGYGAQPAVLMGKLNPNSLEEAERRQAVEQLKLCIDEAAELGARRMAFLSGKDPGEATRAEAVRALVRSVGELSAYGRQRGVALTLETFDRDVDKKALLGPSPLAAEFAAEVRRDFPEFGLMYDLSHQPLLHEEADTALAVLKEHLVHIHVGNCVAEEGAQGYGDLHPRFGWPKGSNDIDELVRFVRALFRVGYLGDSGNGQRPWVGFEVKPQAPPETSEQVIAGTKRVWEEAWSRV